MSSAARTYPKFISVSIVYGLCKIGWAYQCCGFHVELVCLDGGGGVAGAFGLKF